MQADKDSHTNASHTQIKNIKCDNQKMNKRRSIKVIKNGRPKKLACTSAVIKNDHPKKLAHFQDQAIIPRTFEKTFRRQILRSRHKNTTIPEEESS